MNHFYRLSSVILIVFSSPVFSTSVDYTQDYTRVIALASGIWDSDYTEGTVYAHQEGSGQVGERMAEGSATANIPAGTLRSYVGAESQDGGGVFMATQARMRSPFDIVDSDPTSLNGSLSTESTVSGLINGTFRDGATINFQQTLALCFYNTSNVLVCNRHQTSFLYQYDEASSLWSDRFTDFSAQNNYGNAYSSVYDPIQAITVGDTTAVQFSVTNTINEVLENYYEPYSEEWVEMNFSNFEFGYVDLYLATYGTTSSSASFDFSHTSVSDLAYEYVQISKEGEGDAGILLGTAPLDYIPGESNSVPEPTSLALMSLGIGLIGLRRRRFK